MNSTTIFRSEFVGLRPAANSNARSTIRFGSLPDSLRSRSANAPAIALAPEGRLRVNDDTLQMKTADELKAELEAGLRTDASDFNPLRVFESRK